MDPASAPLKTTLDPDFQAKLRYHYKTAFRPSIGQYVAIIGAIFSETSMEVVSVCVRHIDGETHLVSPMDLANYCL